MLVQSWLSGSSNLDWYCRPTQYTTHNSVAFYHGYGFRRVVDGVSLMTGGRRIVGVHGTKAVVPERVRKCIRRGWKNAVIEHLNPSQLLIRTVLQSKPLHILSYSQISKQLTSTPKWLPRFSSSSPPTTRLMAPASRPAGILYVPESKSTNSDGPSS